MPDDQTYGGSSKVAATFHPAKCAHRFRYYEDEDRRVCPWCGTEEPAPADPDAAQP